MDLATGRSRGTGFACFWNKDDADKVIQQSDLLRMETTGSSSDVCAVVFFLFLNLTASSLLSSPRRTLSACLQS